VIVKVLVVGIVKTSNMFVVKLAAVKLVVVGPGVEAELTLI
jgi:hypothetical protein